MLSSVHSTVLRNSFGSDFPFQMLSTRAMVHKCQFEEFIPLLPIKTWRRRSTSMPFHLHDEEQRPLWEIEFSSLVAANTGFDMKVIVSFPGGRPTSSCRNIKRIKWLCKRQKWSPLFLKALVVLMVVSFVTGGLNAFSYCYMHNNTFFFNMYCAVEMHGFIFDVKTVHDGWKFNVKA